MSKYYITTTLPYVNADPHIGFALEIIQADVLARYHRLIGDEVFFNAGTDEHGKKIYEKAIEKQTDVKKYVDDYAERFDQLKNALDLSYNSFIRTTNKNHIEAAKEVWRRCASNGYIEKGIYRAKYCVGCEMEKTDSDLVDGRCPLHPNKEIEIIEEENYFFKFSKLQDSLLELYKNNHDLVIPENRMREVENFVSQGLKDFSISRIKSKMPWGIDVPGDDQHVMYVWFDALTNYISALGWPSSNKFKEYWGTEEKPNAIQVAGKDNLRQQSAMWQAMLIAANLPTSKQILIHGFITSNGQKMSKSLGNVVNPFDFTEKYGADALRYYLLAKIHPFEDSDFTREKFEQVYLGDLANGLGNLVARVAAMAEGRLYKAEKLELSEEIKEKLNQYRFDMAIGWIWEKIAVEDKYINEKEVWKLIGEEKEESLVRLVNNIRQIAFDLQVFLPKTANNIMDLYSKEIVRVKPLFPKLQ